MRGSEGSALTRRVSSVSLAAYAPVASTPSTCLGIPPPPGGVPALVTCLGEPRFLLQGGPSSHPWVRDRSMALATRQPQAQNEQKAQATAAGKWVVRRGSLLAQEQEGPPVQDKGGTPISRQPQGEGFRSPGIPGSWHKATPRVVHIQDTPSRGRRGEVPFLDNRVGRV